MLLAIDIGNTNVVLGVFDGGRLVGDWRVGTKTHITPDEYAMIIKDLLTFSGIEFSQIDGVIISTVVPPLLPVMTEMSQKYFRLNPVIVTHEMKAGIAIRYDNLKEVGADRIVNAAAAYQRYGGPVIIVDFGTATTFCAVTKDGEYIGGAIAPGIDAVLARFSNGSTSAEPSASSRYTNRLQDGRSKHPKTPSCPTRLVRPRRRSDARPVRQPRPGGRGPTDPIHCRHGDAQRLPQPGRSRSWSWG